MKNKTGFPTPWSLGVEFVTVDNILRQQVLDRPDENGFRMTVVEANPDVAKLIVSAVNAFMEEGNER